MAEAWLDRPAAVRPGEELDVGRLEAFLRRELPELGGPVAVRQFPGGFSNLTYLVEAGGRQLVLRRPPFGAAVRSGHDMLREHRILAALRPVFARVPRVLAACADPEVLGAPFYLMERVEGAILRAPVPAGKEPRPELVATLAADFVTTLADLHAVDPAAAGLGDLGRPEGYVRRQVDGWTERWRRARTDDVPAMEVVAARLDADAPRERGAVLVHNDFKYDNLVLDPATFRVRAVLDWEMATVGDPWMDLGTSLAYWVDPGDPPQLLALRLSPTTLPGNPSRGELVERYARATGEDPGPIAFYYAYGLFKLAVIIQQIYARYAAGLTRDPRFARLLEGVRACAWAAQRVVESGRIDRLD